MTTIRDMISDALQDIQVLAAGGTASAEDAAYCLRKLNRMMAGLQLEAIETDWATLTLDDPFPLDPKHERGVVALLSVEVSPGFGREVDPAVAVTAERARGLLQAAYLSLEPVKLDSAIKDRQRDGSFDFNQG